MEHSTVHQPFYTLGILPQDAERNALLDFRPGFHIRHPPAPHELQSYITPDSQLFHTMHMGIPKIDPDRWRLVVDGLVNQPIIMTLPQLQRLPSKPLVTFHECYGSPLKPPVTNVWRVGNVRWRGVPLKTILDFVQPLPEAEFVWSEGLDSGSFSGREADRYQKDLSIDKAMQSEVLIAWSMNDEPLSVERGGPVRLIVPGWFGTNSTKWLCKLSLQSRRAPSIYTTSFYMEKDPTANDGSMRPVWHVEPNSMITRPAPESTIYGGNVAITGWAWSADPIVKVQIDVLGEYHDALVEPREDFSWQQFRLSVILPQGKHCLTACATDSIGLKQPLRDRRNHCHRVNIEVIQ